MAGIRTISPRPRMIRFGAHRRGLDPEPVADPRFWGGARGLAHDVQLLASLLSLAPWDEQLFLPCPLCCVLWRQITGLRPRAKSLFLSVIEDNQERSHGDNPWHVKESWQVCIQQENLTCFRSSRHLWSRASHPVIWRKRDRVLMEMRWPVQVLRAINPKFAGEGGCEESKGPATAVLGGGPRFRGFYLQNCH